MRCKRWSVYITSGDRQLYTLSTDRLEDAMKQAETIVSALRIRIVAREFEETETVLVDRLVADG